MSKFVILAIIALIGVFCDRVLGKQDKQAKILVWLVRGGCIVFGFVIFASTSFIYVGKDETAHMHKIYLGKDLTGGRIIAVNGEKGPQAKTIPPGFHFSPLLTVINKIEKIGVVTIPEGHYGYLVARDGTPLRFDQTFADPFSETDYIKMITDAEYFLSHGGQKGPQTSVLTPATYRINMYLWEVMVGEATEIEKGFVGVIKSNVHCRVDFGNLKTEKPVNTLPIQIEDMAGEKLVAPLVLVGGIGIWDKALTQGNYYINKKAYVVTKIDTRVQTWTYMGGYKKRYIFLKVSAEGQIEQIPSEEEIPIPDGASDRAIFTKTEGWDVPIEIRVLVQVTPENAPFVVAAVGTIEDVENNILTPSIRSIVRTVCGGTLHLQIPVLDEKGNPVMENGKIETKSAIRQAKVLDLIENRDLLERNVEDMIRPEGLKAGVSIKEIRFGDPIIPPELLVARQREQLAEQLAKAYMQERAAQEERVKSEKAKSTADKQSSLVESEIEIMRSKNLATAKENDGRGEKAKLSLIAEGQKLQAGVLGNDKVVELRKFELLVGRILTLLENHPEILTAALSNPQKFVPERVITMNGNNGGGLDLTKAAAIFGDLLGPSGKGGK